MIEHGAGEAYQSGMEGSEERAKVVARTGGWGVHMRRVFHTRNGRRTKTVRGQGNEAASPRTHDGNGRRDDDHPLSLAFALAAPIEAQDAVPLT